MTELKGRGWAPSAIDRFHARVLAENLGMITADYTRYRADNSILEKGRASYTVRRYGTSCKIVVLTEVKPAFLGPGDIARVSS
jgi:hypothetical protein